MNTQKDPKPHVNIWILWGIEWLGSTTWNKAGGQLEHGHLWTIYNNTEITDSCKFGCCIFTPSESKSPLHSINPNLSRFFVRRQQTWMDRAHPLCGANLTRQTAEGRGYYDLIALTSQNNDPTLCVRLCACVSYKLYWLRIISPQTAKNMNYIYIVTSVQWRSTRGWHWQCDTDILRGEWSVCVSVCESGIRQRTQHFRVAQHDTN